MNFLNQYNNIIVICYSYVDKEELVGIVMALLMFIGFFVFFLWLKNSTKYNLIGRKKVIYGDSGQELTNKYEFYRELPTENDIYRFYWLASAYNLTPDYKNIVLAFILQWFKEKKVDIINDNGFKIIFKESIDFDKRFENDLYLLLCEASSDCTLEDDELKQWLILNHNRFDSVIDDMLDYQTMIFEKEGKCIYKTIRNYLLFKNHVYELDDSLKEEAEKIAGLKRFLNNYAEFDKKNFSEVVIWEDYIVFAQILGIADKVSSDLKKFHPNVVKEANICTGTFDELLIDYLSNKFNQGK